MFDYSHAARAARKKETVELEDARAVVREILDAPGWEYAVAGTTNGQHYFITAETVDGGKHTIHSPSEWKDVRELCGYDEEGDGR